MIIIFNFDILYFNADNCLFICINKWPHFQVIYMMKMNMHGRGHLKMCLSGDLWLERFTAYSLQIFVSKLKLFLTFEVAIWIQDADIHYETRYGALPI